MHRRGFLKVGAIGAGLTLSHVLRQSSADERLSERSGILVFLRGGPSHQDMFDLKPDAPEEFRGQFRPVATAVPGIQICEHLPQLARRADQYAILRGITHNLADHGLGMRYVFTGNRPNPLVKHPSLGSVAGKELRAPADVPAYVAIDEDPEGPGYLGTEFGPLATGEKPSGNREFNVRGITLDGGLTVEGFRDRRALARDVDQFFRGFEDLDDEVRSLDQFSNRAYSIISSPRTREAFDLKQETDRVVEQFGKHETGQCLLLATRLIQAGVRFVTVVVDGWDTHQNNFKELKDTLLPQFDQGLAALLDTLGQRDLLPSTSVLVTGEFGRTPKINSQAGRDHWARAMFALMAGGSVRTGQVIGQTDDKAAEPVGDGFSPDDLAATFYQSIGIDPQREYHIGSGRPITLVREGKVIPGLL